MCKIFPLVPSKKPVNRENWDKVFTFQVLNDKFLPNCQVPNYFFGTTVNFIIQKLKSKHLVCLSFLWWQVFLREWEKIPFLTFPACFSIPIIFSNLNSNCSYLPDLRNLQEQVKKAFCYQRLSWLFTVWINCSSDLKNFENSRPSASNFKSFSRSLEHFFLTVGQNNYDNKIPHTYSRPYWEENMFKQIEIPHLF